MSDRQRRKKLKGCRKELKWENREKTEKKGNRKREKKYGESPKLQNNEMGKKNKGIKENE